MKIVIKKENRLIIFSSFADAIRAGITEGIILFNPSEKEIKEVFE